MTAFALLLGTVAVAALAAGAVFVARPVATLRTLEQVGLWRVGLRARRTETAHGTLTWWVGGEGPPLLLLHGANDHAGTWSRVARELRLRFRLIAPDAGGGHVLHRHWSRAFVDILNTILGDGRGHGRER